MRCPYIRIALLTRSDVFYSNWMDLAGSSNNATGEGERENSLQMASLVNKFMGSKHTGNLPFLQVKWLGWQNLLTK
jgi:hypothetical protein